MQALLNEIHGKTFRVKCHHGCEHAGDGILFKFQKGGRANQVKVIEVGLDRHDKYELPCSARMGSSENWVLLKQKDEDRPYTFAIHRLAKGHEIYISGKDSAVDYQLEEVDPRYEQRDYYERRPSLKKARRKPSTVGGSDEYSEDFDKEHGGEREFEYCAHSRSRSRSRSRSVSAPRNRSRGGGETDEGSYDEGSYEEGSYSYETDED